MLYVLSWSAVLLPVATNAFRLASKMDDSPDPMPLAGNTSVVDARKKSVVGAELGSCESVPGSFTGAEVYKRAVQKFDDGLFLEMGAYLGQSSCYMSHLLQNTWTSGSNSSSPRKKNETIQFHVIDPWGTLESGKFDWDSDDHKAIVKAHNGSYKATFDYYMNTTGSMRGIAKVIEDSDSNPKVPDAYGDESISFLYLDSARNFKEVNQSLHLWWPKTKVGGMFCGDDYHDIGWAEAVDTFFADLGEHVENMTNYQFCVTKQQHELPSSVTKRQYSEEFKAHAMTREFMR